MLPSPLWKGWGWGCNSHEFTNDILPQRRWVARVFAEFFLMWLILFLFIFKILWGKSFFDFLILNFQFWFYNKSPRFKFVGIRFIKRRVVFIISNDFSAIGAGLTTGVYQSTQSPTEFLFSHEFTNYFFVTKAKSQRSTKFFLNFYFLQPRIHELFLCHIDKVAKKHEVFF